MRAPRRRRAPVAPLRRGLRPCRKHGFSLLEVMVSLGVLAFGVLGVTAGHLLALKVSTSSRIHSFAVQAAEEQLEIFRVMRPADVLALTADPGYPDDPNNPIDPDPNDDNDISLVRRWTIEADTPETGVITITVEVDWVNAIGNTRTARIGTLKADL